MGALFTHLAKLELHNLWIHQAKSSSPPTMQCSLPRGLQPIWGTAGVVKHLADLKYMAGGQHARLGVVKRCAD